MTVHTIKDFHGDGVFRDGQGTIWVPLAESISMLAGQVSGAGFTVPPIPEELCGVNGCVFLKNKDLTSHEGIHSWQPPIAQ